MRFQHLLAGLLLTLVSTAHSKTLIISDLDDTIKYTHVASAKKLFHGVANDQAFFGMPELVMGLKRAKGDDTKLFVVSGSPKAIKGIIENMLRSNGIEADDVVIAGKTAAKPQALEAVMKAHAKPGDDVILLGDSVESDSKFYLDLKKKFPNTKTRIYIHRVSTQALPRGIREFATPIEVAHAEGEYVLAVAMAKTLLERTSADPYVNQRILKFHFPEWKPCVTMSQFMTSVATLASAPSTADLMGAYYTKLIEPVCARR